MARRSGVIVSTVLLALLCWGAVAALAWEPILPGAGNLQAALVAPAREPFAAESYATVITVTSSLDPDTSLSKTCYAGTSPEAPCTLRRAFVEANLTSIARPVLIKFNIPLTDPGYVEELEIWRIELAAALPVLRESQITIDGQTQNEIGGRTTAPPIYIQGSDIVDTSTALLVRYLALADGKFNVWDDSTLEYNWTGLTEDGENVYYIGGNPQLANGAGINLSGDNNTVRNNVTASSDGTSLDVDGSDNLVVGNFVGTNARGTLPDVPFYRKCHTDARFHNWFTGNGIVVHNTANRNQIGGATAAERNVIAGMLFASDSPESTPPVAINILGDQTLVQNNYVGLDVDGQELWVCGVAVLVDGEFNEFLDNAIANAGVSGFSINGSAISLDAITLQGNVIVNTPGALVFGPGVPSAWKNFRPAQITSLVGTAVGGTSGADSPCANCVVELFLDDGDDQVETLESLVTTTTDAAGNWTAALPRALADGEGLRTASTTADWDQIPSFEAGTTTGFSDLYPSDVTPPAPTPVPTLPPPEVVPTPAPVTSPELPATYTSVITVTSAGDPDTNPSKSCYTNFGSIQPASPCTLRRAIVEANALNTAARPVLIKFNIPPTDGYDPTLDMWTITLIAELPNLAGEWVIVDGETQGEIGGRAGAPKLLLQGSDLTLNGNHDAVRHLALLDGRIEARGDYVLVEHNWAGLVADGQSVYYVDDDPTVSNGAGIDALGNYGALRDNSAASADGISIKVDGSHNLVVGNTAGTRADGTLPDVTASRRCRPDAGLSNPSLNWFTGVGISISGDNNWIGGATAAERNVIAGMLFASESPNVTPPDAVYLASTADYNVVQNNYVGVDANGQDAWVCGQALVLNGKFNWTVDNTLAHSQLTAVGIYGTYITLDALTLHGNIIRDVPAALEFGPGVPTDWSLFQPADITSIDGTTVSGTSGSGSPCPYCIVELFLDNDDEYVEALASWGTTTAGKRGNWSLTLPRELTAGEGLRTTSTTQHYGVIANFEAGTTSGFSQLYSSGWTVYLPLVALVPGATVPAAAAPVPDFSVDSTGDQDDAIPGDGDCATTTGTCTLRAAIQEANALTGAQSIVFDSSITALEPASALPALDDASGGTSIRGNPTAISGASAGTGANGFVLESGDNKLQALYIVYFAGNGVQVRGDNNVIGADGNGTGDAGEGNAIGSNGGSGIDLGGNATGNRVSGNLIGLAPDGQTVSDNTAYGVYIADGAHANLIGTDGDGTSDVLERNVISGNGRAGVFIWEEGADGNVVAGNYIGTNAAGDAARPNGWSGVHLSTSSANNRIGTDGDGTADEVERNVISGNGDNGIFLDHGSSGNVIAGNYVGTDTTGQAALPNDGTGIVLSTATNNRLGTNADGVSDELERNVISGNDDKGVSLYEAEGNVIAGNYIGTNATGDAALPNIHSGVRIQASAHNRVGGTRPAERNVISGNLQDGVWLYAGAVANVVQGNYIGTDAGGSANLGNGQEGVLISTGGVANVVGGPDPGAGNLIAFNSLAGIRVSEYGTAYSYDNNLRGNTIFANGALGIDLIVSEMGVTPNDPGDGDDGPNHLQNFPVLTWVVNENGQLLIGGALDSISNTVFALDFYANSSCDPSGYGEGELYLGVYTVTTDSSGDANFEMTLPISVPVGHFVTVTATDPEGNTSEFSACYIVIAPYEPYRIFIPIAYKNQ